jgi:CDP-diacylglycerol--glycerol-3-phosphate 3-phosphatidyltransferase
MNVADRITTARIVLAPVFFALYNVYRLFPRLPAAGYGPVPFLWIVFIVAELTDMLDGMAARRRGEVSDFGKLYDPFADTLTQITLFFCFVWDGVLPALPFLLVLYREFGILFIRNLMLKRGVSQGARLGGKIKTVAYIAAAVLALCVSSLRRLGPLLAKTPFGVNHYDRFHTLLFRTAGAFFWLAVLLALISFADYIRVYRAAFRRTAPAENSFKAVTNLQFCDSNHLKMHVS